MLSWAANNRRECLMFQWLKEYEERVQRYHCNPKVKREHFKKERARESPKFCVQTLPKFLTDHRTIHL